jgi:hypothetical protein
VSRRSVTAALLLGIAIPTSALADHSHHHDASTPGESGSMLSASVGLTAATYRQTSFEGEYQGITPGVHWARSRFSASTGIGAYRLRKNGRLYHGVGDLFVHGQVTLIQPRQEDLTTDPHYHHRHHVEPRRSSQPEGLLGGLGVAVSAPTGSQRDGLGMGHVMVMSALWASWTRGELTFAASGGYGRAIGASQSGDHAHGTGPIVDPMNLSEITWSASGDYQVARALRLGARLGGAIALENTGVHRTIGAARAIWTAGRVDTTAEVQVGIAGDPFDVRGMIETALRF